MNGKESESLLVMPDNWNSMDCTAQGILQARMLELGSCSTGDLPNPGIKPRSLTLQADSSPSEPTGKP